MILTPYGFMTLAAVACSLTFWRRLARKDPRVLTIYLGALVGAFLGAKIVYFMAEGWLLLGQPDFWRHLATGKTILGGLIGGYLAVEAVKAVLNFTSATGDWFALIVPPGILLGRIGCWTNGCCHGIVCHPSWFTVTDALGTPRWPSVPVEMLFNLLAWLAILWLRRTRRLAGQHFHLYLIAYGLFRFLHEFLRDEPRILYQFSGYQIAAVVALALGVTRFVQRANFQTYPDALAGERPSKMAAPALNQTAL
jgi:phosphatidylglycerol:prolipoprotein diacylglycerol transferase